MSSFTQSIHALEDLITVSAVGNRADLILGREQQLVLEKSYIVVQTLLVGGPAIIQILDGATELATLNLVLNEAKNVQKFFIPATGILPLRRSANGAAIGVRVKTTSATGGVIRAYLATQVPESTS